MLNVYKPQKLLMGKASVKIKKSRMRA